MAKILLAEDNSSMRQFLEMALRNAGHDVAATEDGLKAYEAFTADNSYDLLLADIVMPGMDGIELSQKITKQRPETKVMFITGFAAVAMDTDTNDTDASGAQERPPVLSKPFHLNDLIRRVDELLIADA